jgi:hypothetical protein
VPAHGFFAGQQSLPGSRSLTSFKKPVHRKKIKVPPGKSYCSVDNGISTKEEEEDDDKEERSSSDEVYLRMRRAGDLQRIQMNLLLDPAGNAGIGTRKILVQYCTYIPVQI